MKSFARLKSPRTVAANVAAMVVLALAVAAIPAQAQTYTLLYTNPGGIGVSNPTDQAIAQGRDGNLYATSTYGGTDYGTFFKFTPAGAVTVLNDTVGGFVASGVTLGTDGNFYGTNQDLGPTGGGCGFSGCGQVYKMTPAGVETVLYNFTNSATDGYDPHSAPVEATNGKFYGTTPYSAGLYISIAYSVTSTGTFSTVHTFANSEGQDVFAGFVQGTDGNLYGVAADQGANGYGTVFKMTTAGVVTVLHSFTGSDGNYPYLPLIQASDGNFYGTTAYGGANNAGVVFKITPSGTYTLLHSFEPSINEGNQPSSALTQATDGKLYGTTFYGGPYGNDGTLFSITPSGTFATLYNFCPATGCADGAGPNAPMKQNTNGILYGTTYNGGGSCNCGVVYSLNIGASPFASLVTTSGKEGANIGILGQGFSSSSVVKFGGVQATTVTHSGATFITATVPAAALTGPVTVTTGSTTLTSNKSFRVTPTITSFAPPSGPVGTSVVITGTGLTQATKVTFNLTSASFTVNSDTQITATVPTGATTGRIAVTTKGGSVSSATSFTVN